MQLADAHRKNLVTDGDAPAPLPIATGTSSAQITCVLRQQTVFGESPQPIDLESSSADTDTEKSAVPEPIVQQIDRSFTEVIDLEVFEVPSIRTPVSHSTTQVSELSSQQVWKGGMECIIID